MRWWQKQSCTSHICVENQRFLQRCRNCTKNMSMDICGLSMGNLMELSVLLVALISSKSPVSMKASGQKIGIDSLCISLAAVQAGKPSVKLTKQQPGYSWQPAGHSTASFRPLWQCCDGPNACAVSQPLQQQQQGQGLELTAPSVNILCANSDRSSLYLCRQLVKT